MKKVVFCMTIILIMGVLPAWAVESSEDFHFFTDSKEAQKDDSANEDELLAKDTPVGDGAFVLLSLAGLYGVRRYYKRKSF